MFVLLISSKFLIGWVTTSVQILSQNSANHKTTKEDTIIGMVEVMGLTTQVIGMAKILISLRHLDSIRIVRRSLVRVMMPMVPLVKQNIAGNMRETKSVLVTLDLPMEKHIISAITQTANAVEL